MDILNAHKAQNVTVITSTIPIYIIMNKLSSLHIYIMSKPITLHAIFHPNRGSNIIRKIQKNFTGSELCFFVFTSDHETSSMFWELTAFQK